MEFSGLHCCLFVKVPKESLCDSLQIASQFAVLLLLLLSDSFSIISYAFCVVNSILKIFLRFFSHSIMSYFNWIVSMEVAVTMVYL